MYDSQFEYVMRSAYDRLRHESKNGNTYAFWGNGRDNRVTEYRFVLDDLPACISLRTTFGVVSVTDPIGLTISVPLVPSRSVMEHCMYPLSASLMVRLSFPVETPLWLRGGYGTTDLVVCVEDLPIITMTDCSVQSYVLSYKPKAARTISFVGIWEEFADMAALCDRKYFIRTNGLTRKGDSNGVVGT